MLHLGRFFIWGILVTACGKNEIPEQITYDGPQMEMTNVKTMITDSGKVVVVINAPIQLDFEDGDRQFPQGVFLEYYQKKETTICTFQSNRAYYNVTDDLWKGEGNVVVKNLENGDELTTEELFWSPKEKKFFTDKFVSILSDGELHKGEGLTADEDFNTYRIHKPSGTITVEN